MFFQWILRIQSMSVIFNHVAMHTHCLHVSYSFVSFSPNNVSRARLENMRNPTSRKPLSYLRWRKFYGASLWARQIFGVLVKLYRVRWCTKGWSKVSRAKIGVAPYNPATSTLTRQYEHTACCSSSEGRTNGGVENRYSFELEKGF